MTYRILPWTHQFTENCCYTATHYTDTVAGDLQDTALNTSIHWKLLIYSNTLHWHSCWWPTGYCLEHINSLKTAVIQQHITLTQLLVTYRILPWTHQFTENCFYTAIHYTDTVAGDLQDTALSTPIHRKLLLYSNTLHWHSCWWPTWYCLEHINSLKTAVIQQHITLTQLLVTYRILPWTHQFTDNCCYTAIHYTDTVAGDLQDTALNTSIHWKLLIYSNTLHWHSCWWPTVYCL